MLAGASGIAALVFALHGGGSSAAPAGPSPVVSGLPSDVSAPVRLVESAQLQPQLVLDAAPASPASSERARAGAVPAIAAGARPAGALTGKPGQVPSGAPHAPGKAGPGVQDDDIPTIR